MASISSLGVGSGIDIPGLVSGLVEAEGSAKSQRLDRKEIQYQAKLSALSAVKSALSDFQSTFDQLRLTSSFNVYTASASSTAVFSATANTGAVEGSYDVEVSQLAQSQKLSSSAHVSDTSSVGTGTLVFKFGTYTDVNTDSVIDTADTFTEDTSNANSGTEVAITDGSLQGIRDAVNNANIGVTASIINVGAAGYKLIFSSETGEASALNVTVKAGTDSDGNEQDATGLSSFAYDPTDFSTLGAINNLTETQTALDAKFKVEGIDIQTATNTATDIIENVTINLKSADAGSTHTLTVGRDTAAVESAVSGFVDGYNNLMALLNETTFYDSDTQSSGILIGDATVRGIVSQIRSVINNTVSDPTSEFNSLASIGILTTREGTLEYDSAKLTSALAAKPDEVQYLLAGGKAKSRDPDINVLSVTNNIGEGIYGLEVTSVPTQGTYAGAAFATALGTNFDLVTAAGTYNLNITVDGVASGAITLTAQEFYTNNGNNPLKAGEAMALALQNAINSDANLLAGGASVAVNYSHDGALDQGTFSITSNKYGASSNIEVTSASADFGNFNIAAAAINSGVNGAGTIGGEAATFDGNVMTGSGVYSGFVLEVTGGNAGQRLGIEVTGGQINAMHGLIRSILDEDGLIDSKTDGLNESINVIFEQRKTLANRLESYEARLIKQFSAMDALVAQLNSTSSFLSSQLDSLSNLANRKK